MSTIRDVAKYSGVSVATVSRILSNDENFSVSEKTKEKVLEAVKVLNYEKKVQKKSLSKLNISIIKTFDEKIETDDPYFITLKNNVAKALKNKGIKVNFFELEDIEEQENITKFKVSSALIIIGEIKKEKSNFLKTLNKTIVNVGSYNTENFVDYLKFDTKHSVEIVIDYFLKLNHKKIALLVGRNTVVENLIDFRETHFREIMKKLNLYNENYIKVGEFSPQSGYEMMKEILDSDDFPTAVFCGNDSIAMGAYKAIREKKLDIPEDISVIGFNDLKISKYMIPPLTTVKLDTEITAAETVNLILELIEGGRKYRKKVYIPIELIERESCKEIVED